VTNVVLDDGVPWDGIVEQDFSSAEDAFEHDRLNRDEKMEVLDDIRQLVGGVENYFATRISS
jgi:hypothetical protein